MKKIMIVDDEILVRVGIKSIADWEKYGYQVVGEAANGKEALAQIEKKQPDIVLTDLIMSPVDGFELIRCCKARFPRIRLVVLSSYNDMDNVKKAMKLGAVDYVFKLRVTEQSLISMLDEVSREMDESGPPSPAANDELDQKNIPAVKQRLMQAIVDKSYLDPKDILREMGQLHLNVSLEGAFILLIVSIDDFELNVFSEVIQEVQLLKFSVTNILEEVLRRSFVCDVYEMDRGNLLAVLRQDRPEAALRKEVQNAFDQACEYMVRYLNVSISGAMSGVCRSLADIPEQMRALSVGLSQRIFRGKSFFYPPKEKAGHAGTLKVSEAGIARDINLAISKNDDELIRYLNCFFKTVQTLENAEENDIRESYFAVYHELNRCASGYGIDINKLSDDQGSRLHYVILKADTMTIVRDSFLTVARRFLELLRSEKKQLVRQDILKAQKYIRNNLSEHLTVTGVAEMLNMNSSYFSHLFKKQTGRSFVDYVNDSRIEKAKVLCATTDYRIYEIAAMVGIDSPNYFSELFKKIAGKNPSDYRQH